MSERDKITQSIILVHSLLELHRVLRKPLGISLSNQQQIRITQHHKEVILTTQEHTPYLPLHTHNLNNPLTLQIYCFTSIKNGKQLQE